MTQYRCKYFTLKELVHPDLLKAVPEDILWSLFDERLLKLADKIREKYGVCTVNTGKLVNCGLRKSDADGAKWSAHKFGRALDIHVQRIENQWGGKKAAKVDAYNRVREQLMALPEFDVLNFEHASKDSPSGISWLHIDTANRKNRLFNA